MKSTFISWFLRPLNVTVRVQTFKSCNKIRLEIHLSKIYYCLSALDTRRNAHCYILVDAMHFLKHCSLVSVADKRYIYLFPFHFITWTACFPGSDTGRIVMRFLSTVPWCLLHLSNHSPFIKHMMFYYLSRLLSWIRHRENQNTILKHRPLVSPPAK